MKFFVDNWYLILLALVSGAMLVVPAIKGGVSGGISAALAVQAHAPDAQEVVVCGGGALNGDLMRRLSEQLPGVRVGRSDAHGLDVMQVEAAAFAWLRVQFPAIGELAPLAVGILSSFLESRGKQ